MHPLETPPLPPGTRIGGDVVEAVLGSGGFGTVYRVRGPDGHLCALKLLPLENGAERAWREVAIGTRLRHPNLVRLLGAGQWPDPSPRFVWLKLELIEGPSLDAWAREHGADACAVVERVLEVARGLAVVHEAGVVHRDVKEANILVRQSDGQSVLLDFGVGYYEEAPTVTKGVFPPGTLPYRSPEAWRFGREHADVPGAHYRAGPGDDLYALGVVFYRLLTGRDPFRLQTDGRVDVEAVLHRPPLPPHILNPRVPRAVETVCLRLLAKTPGERYADAVALCEALEELRSQADASWKVPLRGGTRASTGTPRARKARARAVAAVGVGVALVLGGGWLVARRTSSSTSSASPPTREAMARQEVAPAEPLLEPERAAAPLAACREDDAPMKTQKKKKARDLRATVRNACLGLTGAALQACTSAQQQVPPVRTDPPPQQCPAGAVETMTGTLGLQIRNWTNVEWSDVRGRPVPVREDTPASIAGDWDMPSGKTALPGETLLHGRLYFGEKRVYGRFTEARTPHGDTYKVCLELRDTSGNFGLEIEPGSEPGNILVAPTARVRAVDHFE